MPARRLPPSPVCPRQEDSELRRLAPALLSIAAALAGCGGSVSPHSVITIRGSTFAPPQLTVKAGATVRWVNADQATHRVVSGVLRPTDIPITFEVGILDIGFTVDSLTINLGDSVNFTNLTILERQVEIKDQSLNDVFLSPVLQQNDAVLFTSSQAGRFTVRDAIQPTVRMDLTVVGVPAPDGKFDSGVLIQGQEFKFTFQAAGRFPFFDAANDFANGEVIVQP